VGQLAIAVRLARVSLELLQEIGSPSWQQGTNVWLRVTNPARAAKRLTSVIRRPALIPLEMRPMKPTIKIRFTEPQIALVIRAHPNCNLDHLTELSFEFDHRGKIIDCIGTIKNGGNIDRDYAGSGLARLYEKARRKFTARQTSATILQFPNRERLAKRRDDAQKNANTGNPSSVGSYFQ
jgi:hypothetical protein